MKDLFFLSLFLYVTDFNTASLNIRGVATRQRAALYELIRLKRIDVTFVQETHSEKNDESEWMMEWDGGVVLSSASSLSAGAAEHFLPESYTVREVIAGRLILVTAKYERFNLVLINANAPTSGPERVLFLNKVNELLTSCDSKDHLFSTVGKMNQ